VKITHVDGFSVRVPEVAPPFKWRSGLLGSPGEGHLAVLRIRTDDGCEGVSYAMYLGGGPMISDMVERVLRDQLVGEDPFQRELLWHKMWELDRTEEFPLYLLGIVDVALWDLAGRAYNLPTWQVLGGFRTEIPAYASTTTFSTNAEFLEVADQCLELGYSAIKLHAYGDAKKDAQLCAALRAHVGDDVPLMYDGSAGFDLNDAVYLGRALSDEGFFWYEEPMREFSVTAYKWLAERVSVPLNVAETSDGAHMNTADFIASGCATFVRASVDLRGGFTGAMRTAHLADAFRLRAEPHGSSLTSRHLSMAISNATYYESLIRTNPVKREPGVDQHGILHAPVSPGVGLPEGPDYPKELEAFVHREVA
jgi:L-alanine-DL-glutamate epimerase-like enolase superfamily enzyme